MAVALPSATNHQVKRLIPKSSTFKALQQIIGASVSHKLVLYHN